MSKHTVSTASGQLLLGPAAKPAMLLNRKLLRSHVQNIGVASRMPHIIKFFSAKAFEHLLFALHRTTYEEIDRQLQALEQRYPGVLAGLCKIYDLNFANPSSLGAMIPNSALVHCCPAFDVHIRIDESSMRRASKCAGASVQLLLQMKETGDQRTNSNHLIVALKTDKVQQSFIVPLPLVLKTFEAQVCKPNSYQVYEHTLIRKKEHGLSTFADYADGAGQYVGTTSRTWQQRAQEHANAARRGSYLLFHRALRGDLFDISVHEHIVLRAGLNRQQALRIEETEVEERTLMGTHPNGLNMIPGGEAGLRYLSTMTKRPASSIDLEKVDDLLELEINRNLRQPGLGVKGCYSNAKLAALWMNDIKFRIKAMTGQANRLSYSQIRNARMWNAAGWSLEKIFGSLNGMGDREVTSDQVESLLSGKTYASIPHVLMNY